MKKVLKIVYIAFFVLVCLVPLALMPFFPENGESEKRELADFPAFFVTENAEDGEEPEEKFNVNYLSQLGDWFSDHFAFRSKLVTLDSILKYNLFSESSSEKVIVGKNGWLYYAETLGDYTGTSLMTDDEINRIIRTLSLMEEYVSGNGGHFIFLTAPNKNTVYPGNMPANYLRAEKSNLSRLNKELAERDSLTVRTVDLSWLYADKSGDFYHKRDTHWNNKGAVNVVNGVLGMEGKEKYPTDETLFKAKETWDGDLDGMLFPSLGLKDIQYEYDRDFAYSYTSKFRGVDDITIKTANPEESGELFVFRDSFCNSMLPFFAEKYQKATFSRAVPYRFDQTDSCDTVVFEIVERNLKNILVYPPVMKAPEREISAVPEITGEAREAAVKKENGMIHITGTAERYDFCYLRTADGTCFEACPMNGDGYSAYLPGDTEVGGISLILLKDNVYSGYQITLINE